MDKNSSTLLAILLPRGRGYYLLATITPIILEHATVDL